ncbi:MAG: DegV family protein [Vulcanibacillus sp.]
MSKVTFLLDSGSDYENFLAPYFDYPVRVVPLFVNIEGKEYLDGETISKNIFYKEMAKSKSLPKTSQPTPQRFFEIYQEELGKGNEVLFISLSSKLSGTFQSALIGRNMLEEDQQEKIYLVDSLNVAATVVLQLLKANEMLKSGKSLSEVKNELESFRVKTNFIALLDTLENLKKGGRISATKATVGGILNVKPLITIIDELVESLDSFRGRNKGLNRIIEIFNEKQANIDKKYIFILHNYENEELLQEDVNKFDLSQFNEIIYLKIGPTIGTYAGPNTLGFAYTEK